VILQDYINQLKDTKTKNQNVRFLRNYNLKAHACLQNAGKTNLGKFAKETAEDLGLEPAKYSNHSWRRSGATNLADSGCSRTNLKRHGQWTSDAVAEGYIANSRPLRLEKMNMLKPDRLKKEDKKQEAKEQAENLIKALEGAAKPNTQVLEIFLEKPNPDPILSQNEDDLNQKELEEPLKKRPRIGAVEKPTEDPMRHTTANGVGPTYTNFK